MNGTTTLNIELCERFRLKPLEFDGTSDSLFQPFDLSGNAHMENTRYRGEFFDAPIDRIKASFERHYMTMKDLTTRDFDEDAKQENPRPSTP